MRALFLLILIGCLHSAKADAQVLPDTLRVLPGNMGYTVWQGPFQAGTTRINVLMKDCPNALSLYEDSRALMAASSLSMLLGVLTMAAWSGDFVYNGRSSSFAIPVAGAVLIGVSIPLSRSSKDRAAKSIRFYNRKCVR